MAADWEQFQQEAEERLRATRAAVEQQIQEVESFYRGKFAEAQSAALSERSDDVGDGETREQLAARIAQVPGSFSDNAESATDVVNNPQVQAAVAAQGVVTPVAAPSPAVAPGASEGQATVITPAPVSDETPAPIPEPTPASVVLEPQPAQPVPEPTTEPEQTPNPEPTEAVVEEPQEPVTEPVEEETPDELETVGEKTQSTEPTVLPGDEAPIGEEPTVEEEVQREQGPPPSEDEPTV
jgi:hypothetical protein